MINMILINLRATSKKTRVRLVLLLIFLGMFFNLSFVKNELLTNNQSLRSSGIWATLDLEPNPWFNDTEIPHNTLLTIKGRLWNRITGDNKSGHTVELEIDSIINNSYTDLTDIDGVFEIDYIVDPSLDIYSSHIIEAIVLDPLDTVEYRGYYIINVNTTSYFDIVGPPTPKLIGDFFDPNAYLRMESGSSIPFASLSYYWYDNALLIDTNFVSTDGSGYIQNILIPDIGIDDLDLLLSYESPPEIGYSDSFITETNLFSNISCVWDLPTTIRALSDLEIAGRIISSTNPSIAIRDTEIQVLYNGIPLPTTIITDSKGDFSITHSLSNSTGVASISVRLVDDLGKNIYTRHLITIQTAVSQTGPGTMIPPFMMFFSIFLPILGALIGGLAFYGYRYYKKQDKLSKVVNLPLESKIINLKILKDTGRLEESLSYLFNAIYMDLINAKFGRIRSDNETIRDFAIISVKNLQLSPSTLYPFIQKVEEIIYAKPFQITDKEFYNAINLFSPIYFELTGYNFELNF